MKLSIIICVYNTPVEYLSEALRSVTDSTLKRISGDYEICMVDDGSDEKYDYSALVKEYGVKYIKTENGGILAARRRGVEMATGEFSIYLDSDDTVTFNYHLPMLERAKKCGADIVINGWGINTERAKYYPKNDATMKPEKESVTGEDILKCFLENEGRQHSFYVLWNKLFKTDLLRKAFGKVAESGISERTSYSEDAALCFFAFKYAKKLEFVNTGLYLYRIHSSQVVNVTSEKKLTSQIDGMSATLNMMRSGLTDRADEKELSEHLDEWAALMSRSHYSVAQGLGYESLFPYIKEKYGVDKLSLSTVRDGEAYEKKVLLGDNFSEIEALLLSISERKDAVRVKFPRHTPYIEWAVSELSEYGKITDSKSAELVVIPKFRIPFKKRLIYNAFLYRLGLIFFKKGSKARNFLKKFL